MAHPVLMPTAGQSMTEGKIVVWLKNEGDEVSRGEPLLEIETDKANLEVEALADGVLRKIFHQAGDVVEVLAVIGVIGDRDEDIDFEAVRAENAPAATDSDAAPPEPTPEPAKAPVPPTASGSPSAAASASSTNGGGTATAAAVAAPSSGIAASPRARQAAAATGVALGGVRGSGPGGRILQRDVLATPAATRPARPYPAPSPRPQARVELTGMRGAIASALQKSTQTIPHFYATMPIDLGNALAVKANLAARGQKVSVNDLIARAVVLALTDEPGMNCRVADDHIDYPEAIHLGIAVGSDDGLVVPVALDAQGFDLPGLAAETRRIIAAARDGKLIGMGQGTFTISNLGMFGIESFTAIINPPEGAILAVGATRDELVPHQGGFASRPILRVTLSSDHRAIDGVLAARFLSRLQHILEDAARL